jgi:ribosomal protein S17E
MLDSSTFSLEKFICEPSVLEKINNFLCMNGSTKLFFISNLDFETNKHADISVLENLLSLQVNVNVENLTILYFIRHDNTQEVSPTQIFKEVFCGEIKNVSQILFNVYNDMLLKAFETNKNWGNISDTNKNQAIRNMEKFVNGINQFSVDNQSTKTTVKFFC